MDSRNVIKESDVVEGVNLIYFTFPKLWEILNKYREKKELSVYLFIGTFITVLLLVSFVVIQIICFFYVTVDLKEASLLILNPLSSTQSIIKVCIFWQIIDRQSLIMNIFRKDILTSITIEKQKRASEIYKKYSALSNLFCFLATAVNSGCVAVWNSLPIIRSGYTESLLNIKLKSDDEGVNKILGGWYPFPYGESPWYEGVYVYEFFACIWCGVIITMYETLVISLVVMLGCHLKILSYFIENVTEDTKDNYENRIDLHPREKVNSQGMSANDQLLLYVKDHQLLMKVGDDYKNLFNFLITLQLGLGLLIMIISVFHFVFDKKNPIITFKFLIYLTYQVTEIVLYCYSGTFLETASTDVEFATYSTEWYKMDKNFRNTCQMLMIRSQTPTSLIAVRLYPVNSITLLSMMQFTYSTSTLLSKFTENM